MKSKKFVLAGLVLLASVVVLAGCDTPLEPESTTVNEQAGGSENDSVPEVPKYTVKFAKGNNTDEVSDLPADLTVESGTVLTAEQLKPLSYTENYAFVGWYDGETEALAGTYKVTKAVTLTAQWKKGIIVTAKNFNEGLQSAISDPDSILVLEDDITVLETITISSGNVTIDLNGKTLKNESRTVVQVAEGATLTIMDTGTKGSISGGEHGVRNYGSLEVTGGSIKASGDDGYDVWNDSSGKLTVTGGSISGVRNYGSLEVTGGSISGTAEGVINNSSGTLTVEGGNISGVHSGVFNFGSLEVTGGNISGTDSGVIHYSSEKLTVTDGEISGVSSGVQNYGSLEVTGGSIEASGDDSSGVWNSGSLEVTGGSIEASGDDSYGVQNSGSLEVTGGSIKASGEYSNGVRSYSSLIVEGGSISASGESSIGVYNGSSGKLTVTDSEISGVLYGVRNLGSLEVTGGSIEASGDGGYGVKNSGKLEVTGGNISGNYSGVDNQGELTVTGGSIKASGSYGVENDSSGKLTVTDGEISGVLYGVKNSGSLEVTGGNISGNYSGVDNQGELTVTGGSIKASGDGSYGVDNAGILYLSGAPVITSESYGVSFYLEETITLVGDLTGGNSSYSVAWRGATTGGTEIVVGGSISEGEDPFELTDEIENRFTFKVSISSVYKEIEVELDTEKNALVLASVKE